MALTRRTVLATGSALAAGLAAPGILRAQQVKEIRILEAGGKSGESMEPYIKPFTEATGIKVVRENPANLGKLRAAVQAGNVPFCLIELGSLTLEQAKALDLLDPIDWAAIAPKPMFEEAKDPKGFGWQYYSTVRAWRSDAKEPKNWADFWNTKDFPGKRTLSDRPVYSLPIALLADGVPADKLYPLDMDRAFKSLDRIKKDVAVWWNAGAQPPQLLKDNEVQYAVSWSGRVAGAPGVSFTFDQGLIDLSFLAVPKGSAKADQAAAMKLLHHFTDPKAQLAAAEIISYTGPSPELPAMLPKEKLSEYPTVHRDKQVPGNPKWWFDNADLVEKRWQAFKLNL